MAGEDHPVGAFGKGVKRVYERFKRSGIKDVSLKLYKGDRHEILNETDREQVYEEPVCVDGKASSERGLKESSGNKEDYRKK